MSKFGPDHADQPRGPRQKPLAPRTVRTNYGVLRALFGASVKAELIPISPCRGIRLPPVVKVGKPLASPEDVVSLANAVAEEYRPAIYLLAQGVRMQEVCGLRVRGIDFEHRTLTIEHTINEVDGMLVHGNGKMGSSVRTLHLPEFLLDLLQDHIQQNGLTNPEDFVLQSPDGGPLRPINFRGRVHTPALRKAGLPSGLTPHRLRHSSGDHMRGNDEQLETIQKRLGNAGIRTTADIYGTLNEEVDPSGSGSLGNEVQVRN